MEREEDEILLLSQEIATGRDGWTDGFRCRGWKAIMIKNVKEWKLKGSKLL